MKNIDKDFWEEWVNANELERLKKIEELVKVVLIPYLKREVDAQGLSNILNSYFEDLANYLKEQQK